MLHSRPIFVTQTPFVNSEDMGCAKKQICCMFVSIILNVTKYKRYTSYSMAYVITETNTSIDYTLQR